MQSFFDSVISFFDTILSFLKTLIDSFLMLLKMIPLATGLIGGAVAYVPTFIGAFLVLSLAVLVVKLIIDSI